LGNSSVFFMNIKLEDKMIKLDAKQSKALDKKAQEEYAIPGLILMENAGLRAYEVASEILKKVKSKSVFMFCGPGNNGGDGFVVARHLLNNNIKVHVFLLTKGDNVKGEALINYAILKKIGAQIIVLPGVPYLKKASLALNKAGLIIDAIFGIGLNKKISGFIENIIIDINRSDVPVLSLDIPSGLCASSGKVLGCCIKADATVTFGASKKGFYKGQGPSKAGKVTVVDISWPKALLNAKKS